MFVIPCKYNKEFPFVIDLVKNIREFHTTEKIVVVDSNSSDKSYFDTNRETFFYEKNLYADKNYYFITVGETNGKRVGVSENLGADFPLVNEFSSSSDIFPYRQRSL